MGAKATPSLMPPEDLPRLDEYMARVCALADGEAAQFEFRMRDRAGAWHWFLSHGSVFSRDASGAARQTIGVASEITERKQAEEALRESEERIQHALRVSESFTFNWNPETDRVERSASAGAILHLARKEAVSEPGLGYFQRIHPEDRERFVALVAGLRADARDYTVDYRVVCADGAVVSLEEVGRGSFDAVGKLVQLEGRRDGRHPAPAGRSGDARGHGKGRGSQCGEGPLPRRAQPRAADAAHSSAAGV